MERKDTKVVFMGTPHFAVPSLEALLQAGFDIKAVVAPPDKPAGRGLKMNTCPVAETARKHNLTLLQPEKLRDENFISTLRSIAPDIIVVVAFRMLPEAVWSLPALGTFNLHGSLLPQYRGAAPIQRAIMNGEKLTGLTTFLLDDKIDTGLILLREEMIIGPAETAGELHDRMMEKGSDLVVRTCDLLRTGAAKPFPQRYESDEIINPAPKLFRDDMRIQWNQPIQKCFDQIRGLSPYPGAFTTLYKGQELLGDLKIYAAELMDDDGKSNPGTVYKKEDALLIKGKDGALLLKEVQLSGRKRMLAADLLKGWRGEVSDLRVE